MAIQKQKIFAKEPQSYWIDSITQPEYPSLKEDIHADVAIIGGGIVGISTAYMLSQHGIKTVILEADQILQGTTGHTTAKITSQHGLIYDKIKKQISEEYAKQYADANEAAIHMIEKIAKKNNIQCDYTPQSSYVYTLQEHYIDKIRSEVEAASSLGIKATYLEETPLPFPVKAAIRFDNQAQFHPRRFLLPLAEKIISLGSQIYEQSAIVNIEENENGQYTLITKDGKKVKAEKVIIASHFPFYNKHGLYFTRIYPEKSYVVAIKAKEKYPGGMYITAEDPGRSLRSQISDQGELIFVGGEHHKTGQSEDTLKHYEALTEFARTHFTVENLPYHWSTHDCMTLDGIPYVGPYTSKTPHLFIATGFGKWGMTNSIASAILLKDLIVKGDCPWQDVYNPSRHTFLASSKNFIIENLNVAKELIGGKVASNLLDGDIDTTCTHMGCECTWNSAEKTWDCPCHGSRFTYEGDVIEGPALKPLGFHRSVNTVEKLIKDDF
ncbi:MAG: FAD-dependent oxidoreductase [Peptostreptococcales bacterium]